MLKSKLPMVGTTIFSQMSALAEQCNAINLSQGFPEFDGPDFLKQQTQHYIQAGYNQYAPMPGVLKLRQEIAKLIDRSYQNHICADTEVTITSGATEALFVAIQAVVRPGDEVIVFDPAYDSYAPAVQLAGGTPIHIEMAPLTYQIDWQQVRDAITANTRCLIINTPHNPSATSLTEQDIASLREIVNQYDLYIICDEVYEHLIYDKRYHHSMNRYDDLFSRSFIVSSFGKTFHMTGWKLGYCVAPANLSAEFRKIHQFVTFSSFTPAQLALADMLAQNPEHCANLSLFYQQKRDYFQQQLTTSRFKLLPSQGSYFILADYIEISDKQDLEFCYWLAEHVGVAAIPLSVFFASKRDDKVIRFCFAKNESTLIEAASRLCQL